MKKYILTLLLAKSCDGLISKGSCADFSVPTNDGIQIEQNIRLDELNGEWYPAFVDKDTLGNLSISCLKIDFKKLSSGHGRKTLTTT